MDIPEDSKKMFISEARFLRGISYFYLMNLFGGVSIYDEGVDFNDLKQPRSSVEEVRTFIMVDLTAAVESLPVSFPPVQLGRATKGATYDFQEKVSRYNRLE